MAAAVSAATNKLDVSATLAASSQPASTAATTSDDKSASRANGSDGADFDSAAKELPSELISFDACVLLFKCPETGLMGLSLVLRGEAVNVAVAASVTAVGRGNVSWWQ